MGWKRECDEMNSMMSAVYFPFTFISPSFVETLVPCFHRVVVYQPAHSAVMGGLQPWVEAGFLDIKCPFEKVVDEGSLKTALQSFKTWGRMQEHADTAYLKTVGDAVSPAGPEIPQIVSDVSAGRREPEKEPEDRELSLQVFLHLAHEFDEQSREAGEQLKAVDRQYQALQTSFQGDEADETKASIGRDVSAVIGEDLGGFMINKRMAAWNRLFQDDPADSGILVTSSAAALTFLLDSVEINEEIFRLTIPCGRIGLEKGPQEEGLPWVSRLEETVRRVLETPWSEALQKEVLKAGHEMGVEIDEWRRATEKVDEGCMFSSWHVVPHQIPQGLMNRCCGRKPVGPEGSETNGVENTLVVMIQECQQPVL